MKIKMLTMYAGPLGCFGVGQDPRLPDEEKAALVSAGFAVTLEEPPVEPAPEIETTMMEEPPENTAIIPKGRGKR